MSDLSAGHFWEPICDVDVTPIAEWLSGGAQRWFTQAFPDKPQRLFEMPACMMSVGKQVLGRLHAKLAAEPVFSRMLPGQQHGMHADPECNVGGWLTRVHVPIITNPGAWLMFEEQGERFHLPAGKAYTFNALRRHAFGNDGETARVHLLLDVRQR